MEELSFGQWLSRQRKSLGLTQKMLAERVHCATITIRKMESEQRRPSLQVIEHLAQTFNVPHDEQGAFIQFARGYKQLNLLDAKENFQWHTAGVAVHPELLSSLLAQIQQEHLFHGISGFYLDANGHLLNQSDESMEFAPAMVPGITHTASTKFPPSQYILLLVPIKVPSGLAPAFGHELGLRGVTAKHPDY